MTVGVAVSEVINVTKGIWRLNTVGLNQNDEKVVDGYTVVKYEVEK